ncbi:MAG: nucleoside triphosphate pyrophosphohydrolase [Hyphomicrobiaceae bacterium]|nr:nucleoside triphosphate pyrophosphohydrolase [Hyphomicrobiaceae bacterium]
MTDAARDNLTRLLEVMAALRTPGSGCPWDLEQTFETIAPYTIEEAYEVAEAIAQRDMGALKDELGDLLLQVVYHARIAEEAGAFDFAQVAAAITQKMIRRHPHVFGSAEERAAGAAPGFWERLKAAERAERAASGAAPPAPGSQVLADVPLALPALTRAVKLQAKAARVGFDWPSLGPVLAKAREEMGELEDAIAAGRIGEDAAIAEELGDLMFVMANVARHLKVDPETALRKANEKFVRRFSHIEAALALTGRTPEQSDLDEMDRLWTEAKARERGTPIT